MKKIIFLLHHQPTEKVFRQKSFSHYEGYGFLSIIKAKKINNEQLHWIGYLRDHTVNIAEAINNSRNDNISIEHWRLYGSQINNIYSDDINEILHKIYLSKQRKIPQIGKILKSKHVFN